MDKKLLDGRIVVITGAAGLLGREFAGAVSRSGGIPVLADISSKAGRYAEEINQARRGGRASAVNLDITSKRSVTKCIAEVRRRYGRIDAVVNSAYPRNKNYGRKLEKVEYRDFCENLNIHLGGYFLVSQQFAEFFKMQGHGNVINISSVYGIIAPRFQIYNNTSMTMPVEYAAIKSALIILTQYMAKYYKGSNIRFNTISAGGILDGQPPSFRKAYGEFCVNKGMLDRADISGTVLYLLSDMSSCVNGQNIIVDDGFTV